MLICLFPETGVVPYEKFVTGFWFNPVLVAVLLVNKKSR